MLGSFKEFIKKLEIFNVIWGRWTKIVFGIKDGGAKATEINDPSRAKLYNGNTIFNINHPDNLCNGAAGGHYHDVTAVSENEICLNFVESDWVNNKIEVIASGTPSNGQIGPHTYGGAQCLGVEVKEKITSILYKQVGVNVIIDNTTKMIYLRKAPLAKSFSGKVLINAFL